MRRSNVPRSFPWTLVASLSRKIVSIFYHLGRRFSLNAAQPLSSIGSIYDVADRLNRILNGAPMFEFIRPHEWFAPEFHDHGRYSGIFCGHLAGSPHHLVSRNGIIDQPLALGLENSHSIARKQLLKGLMATYLVQRMNKVQGRDYADNNLRVRDINIVGDYQTIAGYRQRHVRHVRRVFDNSNRRLARAVLCVVHAKIELFKKPPEVEAGLVAYHLQIYAGTEDFFVSTGRMMVRASSPSPAHISDY